MPTTTQDRVAELERTNAELARELQARTAELKDALDRQTATGAILEVISRSPADTRPVFEAIVETATRLCRAEFTAVARFEGGLLHLVAINNLAPKEKAAFHSLFPRPPLRNFAMGRAFLDGCPVQFADVLAEPDYDARTQAVLQSVIQYRSFLGVPILREGRPIGVIGCGRREVRPVTDHEIAILQTFAGQAAIALENARLIAEKQEALDQQTAAAEVLQVVNSSPGDLAPVFNAILEKAHALCGADHGHLTVCEGDQFRALATHGVPEAFAKLLRQPFRPGLDVARRLRAGESVIQFTDMAALSYDPDDRIGRGAAELAGARTLLIVALRKDEALLGYITAHRIEVRPFSAKEIGLLQNFAAQAVIAMENARLLTETREALEQQTATAEVLQVINSSPGDLAPVFDTMLEKATRLCDASLGTLWAYDGERMQPLAMRGASREYAEYLSREPLRPGAGALGSFVRGETILHVVDLKDTEAYRNGDTHRRALVDLGGGRSLLGVSLRTEHQLRGAFLIYRREPQPFTDKQIALLQNFAAQAVIAMENARLLTETREALEQQTATAELLQVINSSPGDLGPVFDAMLDRALELCGAAFGCLWTCDGERVHAAAIRGAPPEFAEFLTRTAHPVTSGNAHGRLMRGEPVVHIADVAQDEAYLAGDPVRRNLVERGGGRTLLAVPLRKDEQFLGDLVIYRQEVRPFTGKQIALLQNFAAQAVIAMENARLLTETREALEQRTATAEVLQVINSSPGDLAPVFDAIVRKAHALCEASFGALMTYDKERFHPVASQGIPKPFKEFIENGIRPQPGDPFGCMIEGAALSHIHDLSEVAAQYPNDPLPRAAVDLGGIRTLLVVALRKDNALLGVITAYRQEVRPFSDKQIALLQNFAAQAVIAMENARLITETREALEYQTAISEVLGVISGSSFELEPVLHSVVTTAIRLCRADHAAIYRNIDGEYRWVAGDSLPPAYEEVERNVRIGPGIGTLVGRTALECRTVQILDCQTDPLYQAKEDARIGGLHTMLGVPLLRDGAAIGVIGLARQRVETYTEKQVELVRTFADQAVIAIENARLLRDIRAARDAAESALRDLQTAQLSLVHAQKMAALGQLTAGIAHEIKNPLNFVNNFAGLSVELLDELKEIAAPGLAALRRETRAEAEEIVATLTGNLEKITEHGRRADGIVKSMLDHSRGGGSERRPVDINALIEEALNLAYHGARAQDPNFNVALVRDLEPDLAPIEVAPQDLNRVFLNLFGNGFYAADQRRRQIADPAFHPMVKVTTCDLGGEVEIRVRDNGTGIAPEVRDKLFQPFFTTKPTGEGTGLGLSISYDIVTQQHGGTITVDSRFGEFTEFTIRLPRRDDSVAG